MYESTRRLTLNRGILLSLPFVILTVYACAGSANPGASPSPDDPTQPHANVSGSWTFSERWRMDLGPGVSMNCSVSGMQINITQSGSSFSATVQGGETDCDDPRFEPPGRSEGEEQIRGTVDGTSVRFAVEDLIRLSYSGSVDGDSMSGTLRGAGSLAGVGSIRVTGNWSASRSDGRGS